MRKFGLIMVGIIIGVAISIPLQAVAESLSKVGKQVEVEVPVRVNGELLDTPAIGIEGITYTPARSLAETLGAEVDWDGDAGEVVIEMKGNENIESSKDDEKKIDESEKTVKSEAERYANTLNGKTIYELEEILEFQIGRIPVREHYVEAAKFMYDKDPSEENKKFLDDMMAQLEETQQRIEIIKQALSELEAQQQ